MPPTPNPNRTASKAARGSAVFLVLLLAHPRYRLVVDTPIRPPFRRTNPPRRPARDGRGAVRPVRGASCLCRIRAGPWRAVGYLQGRDRLWQMELYRRAASGRLSELLGEATVAIDQRFLTLGLRLGRRTRVGAHAARRPNSVRELRGRRECRDVGGARPAAARASTAWFDPRALDTDRFARDQQALRVAAWREPQGRASSVHARRGDGPTRRSNCSRPSPEWAPAILEPALTGQRGREAEGRDSIVSAGSRVAVARCACA